MITEQPYDIIRAISEYLSSRCAVRLMTTGRYFHNLFVNQNLYSLILRQEFPTMYSSLVGRTLPLNRSQKGRLWHRLNTMKRVRNLQDWGSHNRMVTCINQLQSGEVISGSLDKTIKIWSLPITNTLIGHGGNTLIGHGGRISSVDQLVTGDVISGSFDKTVRTWTPPNVGQTLCGGRVVCLTKLSDGRIAAGLSTNVVHILLNGLLHQTLTGHKGRITCIRELKDGRIVTGSADRTVRVWDSSGDSIVLTGHTDLITCITQLMDNRIVSGSRDNTMRVWPSLLDGSPPIRLDGPAHPHHYITYITCITQLRDGRIATGHHNLNVVQLWKLDSLVINILNSRTPISCMRQLADDRVAMGSFNSVVRVWEGDDDILFDRTIRDLGL